MKIISAEKITTIKIELVPDLRTMKTIRVAKVYLWVNEAISNDISYFDYEFEIFQFIETENGVRKISKFSDEVERYTIDVLGISAEKLEEYVKSAFDNYNLVREIK